MDWKISKPLLKKPNVCFEFDLITEPKESEEPCSWGMKYHSVIGFGKAIFIEELDEKRKAMDIIMAPYTPMLHKQYGKE